MSVRLSSEQCLVVLLGALAAPAWAGENPDAGAASCTVRFEFVRNGEHVPGQHFSLIAPHQESQRGVTDVQGQVTVELPAGEWNLIAPSTDPRTTVTCPGPSREVRVELPRRTQLTGQVVNTSGAPVSGAQVVAVGMVERIVDLAPYTDLGGKAVTDRDGRFEFVWLGERLTLGASTPKARSEVVVVKGERVTLVVADTELFRPRVVGPAAARRYVLLERNGKFVSTVLEPRPSALQLTAGAYTALVRQESEGRTWSGRAAFQVVPGVPVTPDIELHPVVLEANVTRDGKPVEGVTVEAIAEGWPAEFRTHQSDTNWAGSAVTGRDGAVTLSPKISLAAPKFLLRVTSPRSAAKPVEALLGGPRVTIELPEPSPP